MITPNTLSENDAMMVIKSISKTYGIMDKTKSLYNLTITLKKGKCICLVGRNGAGKSTALKIIAGLISQSSGNVTTGNRIGYLPETLGIYPNLTLRDNLKFFARLTRNMTPMDRLLTKLGLPVSSNPLASKLSKGMKRKLAFAMIMVQNPDIYLLDEPFEGVDYISARCMITIINELKHNNKGFIISSHSFSYLDEIADEVMLLDNGITKKTFNLPYSGLIIRFSSDRKNVDKIITKLGLRANFSKFPDVLIENTENPETVIRNLMDNGLFPAEYRNVSLSDIIRGNDIE